MCATVCFYYIIVVRHRSGFGFDNYQTFMKVLEKCNSVVGFVVLALVHILLET